jgi:glycosyltransferase involved in cell wall biosynthesis
MGLNGALTIGVVGSIAWNRKQAFCYGWEVIEILNILRNLPIRGVIIGSGDGLALLAQQAKAYGITDKVVLTGWIDHDVMPQYINLLDVCLCTQSNDLVGRVRLTAKLPEYLACGRYIIATDVGNMRDFVQHAGVAIPSAGLHDQGYIKQVADHLTMLWERREMLEKGLNGVDIARKYFDYSVLRPQVKQVIDGACQ